MEENVTENDRYLIKILLVASKKAVTRNWGRVEPPTKKQYLPIIDELKHKFRLKEAQLDKKVEKMDDFTNSNWRHVNGLK